MTNRDIQDLTIRISQALDQNYDVINMETVLSVISDLEGTKITKEQLETTRLAKYINHLRRRTKSENLARRAKTLLKRWREMVGIQQTPNENTSQISNSNIGICENTNLSDNLVQQTVYNPSVQIVTYTDDPTYNKYQNAVSIKGQNQTIPTKAYSNTRPNLKKNNQNQNNGSGSNLDIPNSFAKQHPTSFANLIPELVSDKSNIKHNASENPQNHLLSVSSLPVSYPTETYVIDHSSNSSVESKPTKYGKQTVPEPIVIDIQDSDSEHEVSVPQKSNAYILSNSIVNCSTTTTKTKPKIGPSKLKKSKKDKKKKDSDQFLNPNSNCVNIINDTCSNPYQQILVNDEEKSTNSYPVANISEILSLSNSSMSTFFPGENQKSSYSVNDNRDQKTHVNKELTFAGKFKKNNVMQNVSTIPSYNSIESPAQFNSATSKADYVKATTSKQIQLNSISNESSSSRLSQFDVLDVVNHDNSETKLTQAARSIKQMDKPEGSNNTNGDNIAPSNNLFNKNELLSQPVASSEVKIPKKRGRKKGSKGVDSIIAKETSLSTQILISSLGNGGKKVKTTKELYAEMQNRKLNSSQKQKTLLVPLGTTNRRINSKLNLLNPESSCSEISLQSPLTLDTVSTIPTTSTTNALPDADSDSASGTSAPSHGSGDIKKERISMDSNSDSEFCLFKNSVASHSENPILVSLQKELQEIIKQCPRPLSISDIEKFCSADNVQCTCKIVEIEKADNHVDENSEAQLDESVKKEYKSEICSSTEKKSNEISLRDEKNLPEEIEQPKKPIKSIFDLDFDDEEDPLEKIKAEVEAAAIDNIDSKNHITDQPDQLETKYNSSINQLLHSENAQPADDLATIPSETLVPKPLYQVEEDTGCVAKDYFEIRTQKITQFHINVLHNCFIPNINGNWSHAVSQPLPTIEDTSAPKNINVVPRYDSFETERIVKDLSNISFECGDQIKMRRNFSIKQSNIPFLGVATLLLEEKLGLQKQKAEIKILDKQNKQLQGTTDENAESGHTENDIVNNVPSNVDNFVHDGDMQEYLIGKPVLEHISVDVDENHLDTLNNLDQVTNASDNRSLLKIAKHNSQTNINYDTKNMNEQVEDFEPINEEATGKDYTELENQFAEGNNNTESSSSRRSSSCSNSSLKMTQQSINLKLRKLQLRQEQASQVNIKGSNRKRKRKKNNSKTLEFDYLSCAKLNIKNKNVKRLKIAINGDNAIQREIFVSRSNSSSEDSNSYSSECEHSNGSANIENTTIIPEKKSIKSIAAEVDEEDACFEYDEDEDSSSGIYHEVVTRASTTNGNNHIVLTIKKTPSKTNSPSNSLHTISPIKNIENNVLLQSESDKPIQLCDSSATILESKFESKSQEICNESNVITKLHNGSDKKYEFKKIRMSPTLAKVHIEHSSLFFPDELQIVSSNGYEKEFIFDCCSYSYSDQKECGKLNSYMDCESSATPEKSDLAWKVVPNNEIVAAPTSAACADLSCVSKYDYKCSYSSNIIKSNIERQNPNTPKGNPANALFANKINTFEKESCPENNVHDNLPIENNRLLTSFNMIYPETCHVSGITFNQGNTEDFFQTNCTIYNTDHCGVLNRQNIAIQSEIQKNNCDEHISEINSEHSKQSKYNSNELNIVSSKNNSKFLYKEPDLNSPNATPSGTLPCKEYSTGIRAVDEDVDDDDGNNCAKIQQFKEWHQVLQLRSYNEELLTVLPYVVLD